MTNTRQPDGGGAGAESPESPESPEPPESPAAAEGLERGEGPGPGERGEHGDCAEQPLVHALADGELSAREAARVRHHLACCARCRAELAFLLALAMAVARGVLAAQPRAIGGPS